MQNLVYFHWVWPTPFWTALCNSCLSLLWVWEKVKAPLCLRERTLSHWRTKGNARWDGTYGKMEGAGHEGLLWSGPRGQRSPLKSGAAHQNWKPPEDLRQEVWCCIKSALQEAAAAGDCWRGQGVVVICHLVSPAPSFLEELSLPTVTTGAPIF